MNTPYKAVFIIPKSAIKTLDSVGWLFQTSDRVRQEVLDTLKYVFSLKRLDEHCDIVIYAGEGIKMSVIYDSVGLIEQISLQLRAVTEDDVRRVLSDKFDDIDIFVPINYLV